MIVILCLCSAAASASPPRPQTTSDPYADIEDFGKFLEDYPSIVLDLRKDPTLVTDPDYLAQHSQLREFLKAHPDLEEAISSKFKDQHCGTTSPAIFDKASPAVVYIYATSINPYQVAQRVEHIVGSGFIFDASGLILTNSHVAFGRQFMGVTLDNGTSVQAQLVGADPILDIAVLRIPKPNEGTLPVVELGDSDRVRVGEDALAIGNPLGLDQTLTVGTVSAINRILPPTFLAFQEPLIQIDTAINPGNSGGPLLNRCGEVVGITTATIPDAQNIGFAIPINLAKAVIPSLLAKGRVIRPWLGFHGQFIDHALQEVLRTPLKVGFLIEVIEPGSPAEQAELRGGALELNIAGHDFLIGGDIITRLNGTDVTSPDKFIDALHDTEVGSSVSMTVFRDGKNVEVKYTLPERPLLPGDIPAEGAVAPLAGRGVKKTSPCCAAPLNWPRQLRF
ncbi:MAG TPA: trypsin-like peptidase domain-containing protein [Blastocatellia bacterium]|nr:trypsin-like peptidase domain-containing protein [Blastocatellia bacterium]